MLLQVLSKFPGKELENKTYMPLFPYFAHFKKRGAFRVLCDGYVRADSGTGVVHQAPAFGEDDYRIGITHGARGFVLSVLCPECKLVRLCCIQGI